MVCKSCQVVKISRHYGVAMGVCRIGPCFLLTTLTNYCRQNPVKGMGQIILKIKIISLESRRVGAQQSSNKWKLILILRCFRQKKVSEVCSVYCEIKMLSMLFAMWSVQCPVWNLCVQNDVCSVNCAVSSVQCQVCGVYCATPEHNIDTIGEWGVSKSHRFLLTS